MPYGPVGDVRSRFAAEIVVVVVDAVAEMSVKEVV